LTLSEDFGKVTPHTEHKNSQMRTKTLLLTAALSAVGVATSMAQVYSVNAVGYVNTTLVPGFNLVSNPLSGANNSIQALFSSIPLGSQVFKFNGASFDIATADQDDDGNPALVPANVGALTVVPGEGVFVKLNATANATVTFVGEVAQGSLSNPLPAGLSIRSSQVPQAGTASELGLPIGAPGDQLFQWNTASGSYDISTVDTDDDGNPAWVPSLKSLKVGEAFFLKRSAAGAWARTFSVNS
jgi:hypothetical protein